MNDFELSKEKLSLFNLAQGAAVELFDQNLENVLANINDMDTRDGTREINLQVKLTPSSDRRLVTIEYHCKSKLGGIATKPTTAELLVDDNNNPIAKERIPAQTKLAFKSV